MKPANFLFALSLALCGCTVTRVVINNAPRPDDHKYEHRVALPRSAAPVCFAQSASAVSGIDTLLEDRNTCAFLVLQGDSLCYSYYDFGCCDTTQLCLFSGSKSFISTLIGIAIDQGFIGSSQDLLSDYLPCTAALISDSVRICDLLDMRAGFRENGYTTARLYYSPRVYRELAHVKPNRPHGEFHYSSLCTQLLTALLLQATGMEPADYLERNLWEPLRMVCDGYVCTDAAESGRILGFSGMCCTPEDALKLSVLYRDGGVFMGERVVSEQWIDECLNPKVMSDDKNGACYNRHWYVLVPGREFYAKGLFGQYLYVNRDTDTVIARFGVEQGSADWIEMFRMISDALSAPSEAGSRPCAESRSGDV